MFGRNLARLRPKFRVEMSTEPSLFERGFRALQAHAPRILASLLIAAAFVWLFRKGGLPLVPERSAFAKLEPWAIPVYASMVGVGVWFRVHRWVYLLRPIAPEASPRRVVGVCLVGVAAILFAPLRLGEAARPYLLARDGKVSFFQGLGAAGAERVVDGLLLTFVAAIGMSVSTPISPLPNRVGDIRVPVAAIPHAIYVALLVFAGGFTALVVFHSARELAHRLTHRVLDPISPRLGNFVTDTLERLADGLKVLGSPRDRLLFFGETALYWSLIFVATWVLLRGTGIHASFAEACVTLGVLGLGAVIPAGPGFFGTYQIAIYTGLALFFDQTTVLTSGAAMIFVSYGTQLISSTLAGLVGFLMIR